MSGTAFERHNVSWLRVLQARGIQPHRLTTLRHVWLVLSDHATDTQLLEFVARLPALTSLLCVPALRPIRLELLRPLQLQKLHLDAHTTGQMAQTLAELPMASTLTELEVTCAPSIQIGRAHV